MNGDQTAMPGSRIGGQGEMGGAMDEGPSFTPKDDRGNVTGAGTDNMLHTDDDLAGGSTGSGTGDDGKGYGGGDQGEGGGADSDSTAEEGGE